MFESTLFLRVEIKVFSLRLNEVDRTNDNYYLPLKFKRSSLFELFFYFSHIFRIWTYRFNSINHLIDKQTFLENEKEHPLKRLPFM